MKNRKDLEAKLFKAARDHDKVCSGLYDKRAAQVGSASGGSEEPVSSGGIPEFWLNAMQVLASCATPPPHCD